MQENTKQKNTVPVTGAMILMLDMKYKQNQSVKIHAFRIRVATPASSSHGRSTMSFVLP